MTSPARVGDEIDITVERAATGGAVGRVDGVVTFVRFALPGERLRATVTEVARSFQRAQATDVVRASTDRTTPPCPYAAACGGCDLQHATTSAQLAWKSAVAAEHLRRIARVVREISVVDCGPAEGSRTRLRCAVAAGRLGLHRARSHEVEPLERCWVADPRLQAAFGSDWGDAASVELRAIGTGEPFAVVADGDGGTAVCALDGTALTDAVSRVEVMDVDFRVGPRSFWQAHRMAPEVLASRVLAHVGVASGDAVVDLYGGVGLFGVAIARAHAALAVTIVEQSPDACEDARHNAAPFPLLQVVEAPVTTRSVRDVVRRGDVVVVDPPRAGVSAGALEALIAAEPSRVIYVSCDAATLARDLGRLVTAGYRLGDVEAFDLFPMTEHLELVAVLDGSGR